MKFGIVFDPTETGSDLQTGWVFSLKIKGRPAYARKALAASLDRLGLDVVDLWYLHSRPRHTHRGDGRSDVRTRPCGNGRYLGLSNVTAEQVRRAHAVITIAAVQL